MKKKLISILAVLAVLGGISSASLVSASGTKTEVEQTALPADNYGDCNSGYIRWWQYGDETGQSALYCYNAHDSNMDKSYVGVFEPIRNLGPLYDGSYKQDFVPRSNLDSGIRGAQFYDNPNDNLNVNICVFAETDFGNGWIWGAYIHSTGLYSLAGMNSATGWDTTAGSFYWTNSPYPQYACTD